MQETLFGVFLFVEGDESCFNMNIFWEYLKTISAKK